MLENTSSGTARIPRPRTDHHQLSDETQLSVIVIDDHRTFADLLKFAIDAAPGLQCVGVAYDLVGGLRLVATRQPDLVIIDFEFSHDQRDGLTATAVITSRFPHIHVVLLTAHADSLPLERAVTARASSVLPKNGSLPDLMDALRSAAGGGVVDPASLPPSEASDTDHAAAGDTPLSPRERDVLAMLMLGMRSDAIARELGISTHTCRGYVKTLLWKLDAHSQLEAVAIARRRGLVLDE